MVRASASLTPRSHSSWGAQRIPRARPLPRPYGVREGRHRLLDAGLPVTATAMRTRSSLVVPGIEHRYGEADDGVRTAWMLHAGGSWARAAGARGEPPEVHLGRPPPLVERVPPPRLATDGPLRLFGAMPVAGALT
ncbi:hypothetical protein GCM10017688_20940 [Streptomyces ramulosus]